MMRDVIAYAEFGTFWEMFRPDTPFGREEKDRMRVLEDAESLAHCWDETETVLALMASLDGDPASLSRISHHLKRLPRFPEEPCTTYGEVEIFQFKKFLHNYRALVELVDPATRDCFGLIFTSDAFEALLNRGHQSAESFYLADAYAPELADVRARIRTISEAIQAARVERAKDIEARWELSFGHRDFLIIPRDRVADREMAAKLLLIEPYDDSYCMARALKSPEEILLEEQREALLAEERSCEAAVIDILSEAIRAELDHMRTYRNAVTAFDLAFARARMVREHGLTRPVLVERGIKIEAGCFPPCESLCRSLGTTYVPLDAAFNASATVITGSNMGGKTIVLKTLAFLQLCAQTGLFVPAARFETRVFRHFHYIGEGRNQAPARGLSGFGAEIIQLTEAWRDLAEPTLMLFDEFARTTSAREAEAIISGLLERLADAPDVTALFSTHFRVQRLAGVSYQRMRGLDRDRIEASGASGTELEARIRLIDQHMDFRLAEDDGTPAPSDAIAIAVLLGLDPAAAERARFFFDGH